jgi:hypothetical protein
MTTTAKPFVWPERDENGRFLPGHHWARRGGQARAKKLTAKERKAIARKGFDALVASRFGGDRDAAVAWLTAKGQWANDQHYAPQMRVFEDPGPMPENGQAPGGTVSQGSLRERSALHLLLKEYDSMEKQQEQARPQTKDFELAFLDGPPVPVEKPGDCPGYGRQLPASWTCQEDCPLAEKCWEALDGGE